MARAGRKQMGVSMMAVRLRPASLYVIHPQSSSGRARKVTAYGEGSNPSWGYHAHSLGDSDRKTGSIPVMSVCFPISQNRASMIAGAYK